MLCGSLPPGAFDRGVAAACKFARDGVKDDPGQAKQLVSARTAWMHARDACGVDAACQLATMKKRLGELAADGQD